MHTFKRFYLLGSLLAAFAIPFIIFVEYVEIPVVTQIIEQSNSNVPVVSGVGQEQSPTNYLPSILWSIYGVGILVFGFNFIKNLFKIIQRIQKNPKYKINRITNVLLLDRIIPHTFFNYIFLNKHKFEAKEIPSEVLLHEETHALQKHSADVLLVELLQVLFWFNPLIYFTKKAIKLNHEFLADKAVINNGVQPTLYQQILLEFSSNSTEPLLANAIKYSSIKKRFTVMKTKTSKKSIVFRSLLLLPLLTLLLYGFSEKKIIERHTTVETSIPSVEQLLIAENINLRITKKGEILDQNSVFITLDNLKSHLQKFNTKLTKEQRSNIVRAVIMAEADAPKEVLKVIEAVLVDYGVAQINIVGPEKYFGLNQEIREQKGATKEQIKEYDALAKKYNRQLSESKNIQIYKSDVDRLDFINGLMTLEQKENAEPFPDFPEPPPAPKEPKKPKAPKVNKGEKSNIPPPPSPPDLNEVEVAGKIIDSIIVHQDPYDNMNSKPYSNPYDNLNSIPYSKKIFIDLPPTPSTPISPLDHVIEMAKKDATFYFEGKEITSDKAIDLLKKNKNLNIDSRGSKGKRPVVRIFAQPIIIEN
ncbi:MAG: M56 family metallopeptidase [Maribacter sp.]